MAVTITTHRGGFAGVYVPACQLQEEALDEGQESACGAQRIIARLAGCRRGEGGRESIGAGGQAGRHLRISRGSVDHGEPGHHLDAPAVVGPRFGRGGDGCSGDHAPKYFAHSRFGAARVSECGELIDQPPIEHRTGDSPGLRRPLGCDAQRLHRLRGDRRPRMAAFRHHRTDSPDLDQPTGAGQRHAVDVPPDLAAGTTPAVGRARPTSAHRITRKAYLSGIERV